MNDPGSGFICIDDINLEYRQFGPVDREKPTMVFLHEGLGSVAMWKDFPRQLSKATGLTAFVYSRRGYGQSDPAVLPRQVSYMHDEALDVLPKVLDSQGIEKAILVGHSDGGSIALMFAANDPKRRSVGLVLLAPHVFNETLCVNSIEKAGELYDTTDLRERLAKYHQDVDHTFRGWNDIWLHPDFMSWNIEEYLPNVSVPVLHVQGAEDQYGSIAQPNAVKQQCKGEVEVVMLNDCGHSAHFDQPDTTIEAILKFTQKHRLIS